MSMIANTLATVNISWFGQKEWLEINCAMFFIDKVDEMMRYASCFVILSHVIYELFLFSREACKSNALIV